MSRGLHCNRKPAQKASSWLPCAGSALSSSPEFLYVFPRLDSRRDCFPCCGSPLSSLPCIRQGSLPAEACPDQISRRICATSPCQDLRFLRSHPDTHHTSRISHKCVSSMTILGKTNVNRFCFQSLVPPSSMYLVSSMESSHDMNLGLQDKVL